MYRLWEMPKGMSCIGDFYRKEEGGKWVQQNRRDTGMTTYG